MFVHIHEIEIRPLEFDASFAPGEIDLLDPALRQSGDLVARAKVEYLASVEEIRMRGELRVLVETDCERCLDRATFSLHREFDLFYRSNDSEGAGEHALREGEIEISFFDGDGLDLKDVLREQVLLGLPMQRLCREDCKGLCPQCGVNRNTVGCSCMTELTDERWAALRRLSAK